MRWTDQSSVTSRQSPVSRRAMPAMALMAALIAMLARAPAADEKHLTVYNAGGRYNVLVLDRGGREYVALSDLLQPLGAASAKRDGDRFRLRFRPPEGNERELQLTAGKLKGKAGRSDITLPAPFRIENSAPFVPLSSVAELLTDLGVTDIEFHPQARRLLVGNVAVRYQTEMQRGAEPKLVFHFSGPVDPTIATEAGKLRMVFNRAAVVGSSPQSFDDKLITGETFSEANGESEITVSGSGPLMATFSADAKTITISAPPATATAPPPEQTPAPAPPAVSTAPATALPEPAPQPAAPQPARPRFMVAIDAAHGGSETGAMLTGQVAEKDLTLAFARRMQAEFEKQGISSFLVRDGDIALSADQRASAANTARATLFLTVHVGSEGRGVRVYTARIAPPPADRPTFLPWAMAQSWFLDGSRSAAGSIAAEFSKRQMPVAAYSALLPPLNSIAGPALAIEISDSSTQSLSAPAYQQAVGSAVAAGVAAVRSSLEAAR